MNLESSLELFGLTSLEGQTDATLRKIYHQLAQKYHPDKGGSTAEFIKVRKAYVILKTAIINPESQTKEQKERSDRESKYYSSSNQKSTDSESRQNDDSKESGPKYQDYNTQYDPFKKEYPYQQAYKQAIEQVRKYENIFNSQIQTIKTTHTSINQLHERYIANRNNLQKSLDESLEDLEKKKGGKWWHGFAGVQPMDESFYIKQYNHYVQSFNSEVTKIDSEYQEDLSRIYERGFEQIIDLLNS